MEQTKNFIIALTTVVLGTVTTFLGGSDTLLQTMFYMIVFDFLFGTILAFYHHNMSSKKAGQGVMKKGAYLLMVAVGYQLDIVSGQTLFRNLIIWYIIVSEVLSLLEHMDTLDVKYPKFIRDLLNRVLGQLDKGQLPSDWKPDPRTLTEDVKEQGKDTHL